jgi:16S rRNA (cytosine1402-N4)-methyltransferase
MKGGRWEIETDAFGKQVGAPVMRPVGNKSVEPSEEEISKNPRSRSARLRIAEKI